jgi:hypothetical protein
MGGIYMPKGRSTGRGTSGTSGGASGAAGGGIGFGGGGVSVGPTAAGPNNEINEIAAQPIIVTSYSSTRGREELEVRLLQNGQAEVTSGSGTTYHVDSIQNSCTCMDHRIRHRECRHMRAVNEAQGRSNLSDAGNDEADGPINVAEEVSNLSSYDVLELVEPEYNAQDDNFYYTDLQEQEFTEILSEASQDNLTYEYENVLNSSQATFGIEIEQVGGNNEAIARELRALGLNGSGRVLGYRESHDRIPTEDREKWRVTLDSTVTGEIVSPILKDTPETWRQLEKVCEVIKRNGGIVDMRCGGHIHVGVDVLDNSKHRWRRYRKLISGFENVLYRLSTNRNIPSHRGTQFSRPVADSYRSISDRSITIDESGGQDALRSVADRFNLHGHSSGVSTNNVATGAKPTIEFRTFNGSLEPAQIQNNVRVAVGILEAAKNSRIGQETTRKRGDLLKNHICTERRPLPNDHTQIKNFLDIVFTRKKDKKLCLGAYGRSNWQNI